MDKSARLSLISVVFSQCATFPRFAFSKPQQANNEDEGNKRLKRLKGGRGGAREREKEINIASVEKKCKVDEQPADMFSLMSDFCSPPPTPTSMRKGDKVCGNK